MRSGNSTHSKSGAANVVELLVEAHALDHGVDLLLLGWGKSMRTLRGTSRHTRNQHSTGKCTENGAASRTASEEVKRLTQGKLLRFERARNTQQHARTSYLHSSQLVS